jgi:methylglyoxal synthase
VGAIDKKINDVESDAYFKRKIGLVAHDNKKIDLLDWAMYNRATLIQHDLVATGTTGRLVSQQLGVEVELLLSGPLGGDQQIGAMIATGQIDLLIFFWDPLEPQPHDPDVKALLRIAAAWNIPIACNRATADYLVSSPLLLTEYAPAVPDFAEHTERELPTDESLTDTLAQAGDRLESVHIS